VLGDRKIVEGLNFLVTSGMRVGWWAEWERQDDAAAAVDG
jgi:hypothetical protein